MNDGFELLKIQRFCQIGRGAIFYALVTAITGGVRRDHDDFRVRITLLDFSEQGYPADRKHLYVQYRQPNCSLAKNIQGLISIGGSSNLEALLCQDTVEQDQ